MSNSICQGYKKPGEVDRKYLIPFWDSLTPFLPESIKKVLRCGYLEPIIDEVRNQSYCQQVSFSPFQVRVSLTMLPSSILMEIMTKDLLYTYLEEKGGERGVTVFAISVRFSASPYVCP